MKWAKKKKKKHSNLLEHVPEPYQTCKQILEFDASLSEGQHKA